MYWHNDVNCMLMMMPNLHVEGECCPAGELNTQCNHRNPATSVSCQLVTTSFLPTASQPWNQWTWHAACIFMTEMNIQTYMIRITRKAVPLIATNTKTEYFPATGIVGSVLQRAAFVKDVRSRFYINLSFRCNGNGQTHLCLPIKTTKIGTVKIGWKADHQSCYPQSN